MELLLDPLSVKGHRVPSKAELNEEVIMLLVAGNDTTATAMISGLYQICRNRAIYKQLKTELFNAIPNAREAISIDQVKNLPYLVWSPAAYVSLRTVAYLCHLCSPRQ